MSGCPTCGSSTEIRLSIQGPPPRIHLDMQRPALTEGRCGTCGTEWIETPAGRDTVVTVLRLLDSVG